MHVRIFYYHTTPFGLPVMVETRNMCEAKSAFVLGKGQLEGLLTLRYCNHTIEYRSAFAHATRIYLQNPMRVRRHVYSNKATIDEYLRSNMHTLVKYPLKDSSTFATTHY